MLEYEAYNRTLETKADSKNVKIGIVKVKFVLENNWF